MSADQADRHNQGKPKLSLVMEMPHALIGASRIMEGGIEEYGRRNWQKGLPWTEVLDSLDRHKLAFLNGEDIDKKSGLPHVDHMLCNALFLAEFFRTRPEFDDRGVAINRENSFEEWINVDVLRGLNEGDTLHMTYGPSHNTVSLRIVGMGETEDGFRKVRLSPVVVPQLQAHPTAFPAGQSEEPDSP